MGGTNVLDEINRRVDEDLVRLSTSDYSEALLSSFLTVLDALDWLVKSADEQESFQAHPYFELREMAQGATEARESAYQKLSDELPDMDDDLIETREGYLVQDVLYMVGSCLRYRSEPEEGTRGFVGILIGFLENFHEQYADYEGEEQDVERAFLGQMVEAKQVILGLTMSHEVIRTPKNASAVRDLLFSPVMLLGRNEQPES